MQNRRDSRPASERQRRGNARLRLGLVATAVVGTVWLAGCVKTKGSYYKGPPSYAESEPNDGSCCADDLGFLSPGDLFLVQGFIDDSGFDPFDGFAFTASQPVTVRFDLFIDNPGADLDVCVYDPQLGFTVDCFESPFNPESGTVDLLTGLTSFHLVVNSFAGASSYTLQVEVFPLYLGAAPPAQAASLSPVSVQGTGDFEGKPDRRADFAPYGNGSGPGGDAPAAEPETTIVGVTRFFELDVDRDAGGDGGGGLQETGAFALTSEGQFVRMGRPSKSGAGGL